MIRTLHIPADSRRACATRMLPAAAAELSDAIGGGFLDEAFSCPTAGWGYCVYLDENRIHLPPNERLAVLAARLGWIEQVRDVNPRGDALITGIAAAGNDTDVPHTVLIAAWRATLLPQAPPTPGKNHP